MKKKKVKFKDTKFYKFINIISYILSIIFLISFVIAICKSCKKKDNNNLSQNKLNLVIEDIDYRYYYTSGIDTSEIEIDDNVLREFTNQYGLNFESKSGDYQYVQSLPNYEYFTLDNFGYYYNDYPNSYKINFIQHVFHLHKFSNNNVLYYNYVYDSSFIEFYYPNGSIDYLRLIEYDSPNHYIVNLDEFAYGQFMLSQYDDLLLNYVFGGYTGNNFTFNQQINYNAPFGLTLSNFYGATASGLTPSSIGGYVYFDTGVFISNGILYDQIRWDVVNSSGYYFDYGKIYPQLAPSGNYVYQYLMYRRVDNGLYDIVNIRDSQDFIKEDGGYAKYQLSSSTWVNPNYRHILFLHDMPKDTLTKVERFNNNGLSSGSNSYVGDVSDVFTLISTAFTGILPILSITILPGITLGVLLFIPLVVVIIFTIIRILHK